MDVCKKKAGTPTVDGGSMPLRALQLYRFGILDEIASICEKHGLKYILHYGTLLGAIRHDGFIPWDDDIDIAMPWNDYLKLIDVLRKEYSEKFFPQNIWTEAKYPLVWTQVRVNGTTNMPAAYYAFKIHWGMCIDVFPLVFVETDRQKQIKMEKSLTIAYSLLEKEFSEMINRKTKGKRQRLINCIPYKVRRLFVNIILKKYAREPKEDGFVAALEEPKKLFSYSDIMITDKHAFEGRLFSIPRGYHNVLTTEYGDYMTLPPEEDRCGHEKALGIIINDIHKDYKEYQAEMVRQAQ